jgi:hypothetical protein
VVAQIVCTWWLWERLGSSALSIGFSVAAVVQLAVLMVLVVRRARALAVGRLLQSLAVLSSAGFFAALAAQLAKTGYGLLVPIETFWSVVAQIVVASAGLSLIIAFLRGSLFIFLPVVIFLSTSKLCTVSET